MEQTLLFKNALVAVQRLRQMADLYNRETTDLFTDKASTRLYERIESFFADLYDALENTDLNKQMYPPYLRATTKKMSSAFQNVENNFRTIKGRKWLAQAKTPKYNFSAQLKIVRRYIDSITPEQEHLALTIIQFQRTIQHLLLTAITLEVHAKKSQEDKDQNGSLHFLTCESACNVCTKLQKLVSRIGPEYVSSMINDSQGTHVLLSRVTDVEFEVRQLSAFVRRMIEFASLYAGDIIVDELNADLLELSQVGEVIQALINTLPAWDDQ
jgi:hypothetical protein